jgi:hypothetical protein
LLRLTCCVDLTSVSYTKMKTISDQLTQVVDINISHEESEVRLQNSDWNVNKHVLMGLCWCAEVLMRWWVDGDININTRKPTKTIFSRTNHSSDKRKVVADVVKFSPNDDGWQFLLSLSRGVELRLGVSACNFGKMTNRGTKIFFKVCRGQEISLE